MDLEPKERTGLKIAVVLIVLFGLFYVYSTVSHDLQSQESGVAVAAVSQPVTVAMLSAQVITTAGNTVQFGSGYYRVATAYVSDTVHTGFITYTWQSSPNGAVWFDQEYMAGISASRKMTVELGAFGPYLRLAWDVAVSPWVTSSVWLSLKE